MPVSVSPLPGRHFVVGVLIYLNLENFTPGRVLGLFIITCRPSLALLRGPFIIVFRAEFSSIEGTINNQQLTSIPDRPTDRPTHTHTHRQAAENTKVSNPELQHRGLNNSPQGSRVSV